MMKKNCFLQLVCIVSIFAFFCTGCCNEPNPPFFQTYKESQHKDIVAIAVIYDSSGSMSSSVANANGNREAKYTIANRALESIYRKFDSFSKSLAEKNQELYVEFIRFNGHGSIATVIPLKKFSLDEFIKTCSISDVNGGTPLGQAIMSAAKDLMESRAKKVHILLITDGRNSVGRSPEGAIKTIKDNGVFIPSYFITFDVADGVFNDVKKMGGFVLSANNEKELNDRLNYVVEEKIMLEKEE
jgi:hypothetical protein